MQKCIWDIASGPIGWDVIMLGMETQVALSRKVFLLSKMHQEARSNVKNENVAKKKNPIVFGCGFFFLERNGDVLAGTER